MLNTPFKWTDQNIAVLQNMVKEGLSAADVAARLGCSRNAAVGKATRLGTPFHSRPASSVPTPLKKRQPWTEERILKAAVLWVRNVTITSMASTMQVRVSTMACVIDRYPQHFPKRVRPNSGNVSKIAAILRRSEREEKAVERSLRGYDSSVFAIADVGPVRFMDLTDKHCKFPISCDEGPQGADMPCCGARRTDGSYCVHHARIAYGPGTLSERNALNGIGGRQ